VAGKVTLEMSVGITPLIKDALETAAEFQGLKASQYGRHAILEKLVREGYLKHPAIANYEAGLKAAVE
jgi:hypothetical protein